LTQNFLINFSNKSLENILLKNGILYSSQAFLLKDLLNLTIFPFIDVFNKDVQTKDLSAEIQDSKPVKICNINNMIKQNIPIKIIAK
jgi:hypothetical protein